MTLTFILSFALGAGVGLCLGWMLGAIAGRRVHVTRTQRVFLPTDYEDIAGDCTLPPPAPEPTDWDDFGQRDARREEYEAARPAGGLGYRDRARGCDY